MPYLPDLPVAVGRTAEMRCRMGRALPAVALSVLKLGGLSDILLAHHDDVGDAEYYGVFFAARAWLGEIDRAAEDGGAYLRGSIASFTGMHSPGPWKPMMQLRQYTGESPCSG